MNGLRKLLKQISIKSDIITVLLGLILIVSMILISGNPANQYAILAACTSGGFMNFLNGMKFMKDPKKKTMGMTFLMMGVIVILLGFMIMDLL